MYTKRQLEKAIEYWQTRLLVMEAVESILKPCMLSESAEDNVSQKVTRCICKDIQSPDDVKKFVENNKDKYEKALEKLDEKKKPLYKKIWEYLCYAVSKGTKFIIDNFFTILRLIVIIAVGWLAWPLIKHIKEWIDSLNRDKEQDEKELAAVERQREINSNNMKKSATVVDAIVKDPKLLNDNLPDGYAKFSQEQIDFLDKVPREKRELVLKWILCNAKQDPSENMDLSTAFAVWVGRGAMGKTYKFFNTDEYVPSGEVTSEWYSLSKEMGPDFPQARFTKFINAIRSIKDSRGKHKFTPWNNLMSNVEAWDKSGQPTKHEEVEQVKAQAWANLAASLP